MRYTNITDPACHFWIFISMQLRTTHVVHVNRATNKQMSQYIWAKKFFVNWNRPLKSVTHQHLALHITLLILFHSCDGHSKCMTLMAQVTTFEYQDIFQSQFNIVPMFPLPFPRLDHIGGDGGGGGDPLQPRWKWKGTTPSMLAPFCFLAANLFKDGDSC